MEKITNVFGTNQKTKKIISQLLTYALWQRNVSHFKINNTDFEALIKTYDPKDQARMRGNMKLLGVPIYPIS